MSDIIYGIILRSSGVAITRISSLSFWIERNHVILIDRNHYQISADSSSWFSIYSLFLGINYFTSYIRVISNRLFIYSFRFICNVFGFFIFPSLFLRNGYESIFDFFFTSKFQIHHLRISVSNSSRNKYDILSFFFNFQNHFYSWNLYSPLTSGIFWIWIFPKFLWEYHENQVHSKIYFST